MCKKQEGITLIALTITVIVLSIIVGVVVYTGVDVLSTAELQTINTNMLLLQVKSKTISEKANFEKDNTALKGTPLTTILENTNTNEYSKVRNLIDANAIQESEEKFDKYYLLTNGDLIDLDLVEIGYEKDYYIVNYATDEIILTKGFQRDGVTYYKLSDLKRLGQETDI